ncbi:Protein of unknown function [Pyronema omphalodes CBS 100304]|uniref:Uncharacterized protein n=1 Tax=Pyronema omphalodes (strain CBS 100304) TaxID=1076935 RepID=U4LHJ6_PYROM|nr:Protein of unknown function [Pyronema omphalodes CBS 100304]
MTVFFGAELNGRCFSASALKDCSSVRPSSGILGILAIVLLHLYRLDYVPNHESPVKDCGCMESESLLITSGSLQSGEARFIA